MADTKFWLTICNPRVFIGRLHLPSRTRCFSEVVSNNMKIKLQRTITLPVVLYGCGTWSLTTGEEHRLRVFENRVLRHIFGSRRDQVTEE
jgi:hypothetical protein